MGSGLAMAPGDIALKSNFATLDAGTGVVTSRRADRRFEELGPRLCADLDGELAVHPSGMCLRMFPRLGLGCQHLEPISLLHELNTSWNRF